MTIKNGNGVPQDNFSGFSQLKELSCILPFRLCTIIGNKPFFALTDGIFGVPQGFQMGCLNNTISNIFVTKCKLISQLITVTASFII